MKYLAFLFFLGPASFSFANCIDFSGKYQTTDSNNQVVTLTLVQTQCLTLDFTYDYGQGVVFTKSMTMDGKQRTVVDIPTYQSSEADSWSGDQIVSDGIVHNIEYKEESTYKGVTYFDANKKLVEDIWNYDARGDKTWEAKAVYQKVP